MHISNSKEVKRICTVSYGLGLPGCVAATVILSKFGLRVGLYLGATLTLAGGLLCCLSSLSVITDSTPSSAWYWMALLGQALSGFGSPFISCVPTKVVYVYQLYAVHIRIHACLSAQVSQNWFNEHQRLVATTVLGLSNPLGLVLGQAITPMLVPNPGRIPLMNIVWFVPALLGSILTFFSVNRSFPPTPPSRKAFIVG